MSSPRYIYLGNYIISTASVIEHLLRTGWLVQDGKVSGFTHPVERYALESEDCSQLLDQVLTTLFQDDFMLAYTWLLKNQDVSVSHRGVMTQLPAANQEVALILSDTPEQITDLFIRRKASPEIEQRKQEFLNFFDSRARDQLNRLIFA